jgi:hypothetical protein
MEVLRGVTFRAGRYLTGAQSGRYDVAAEQFDAAECEEASHRAGSLAEIPGLLRELGADPAEVAASAGLDTGAPAT